VRVAVARSTTHAGIAHRDRQISLSITHAGAPAVHNSAIRSFSRSDNRSPPRATARSRQPRGAKTTNAVTYQGGLVMSA
jgi:hypothetical protein